MSATVKWNPLVIMILNDFLFMIWKTEAVENYCINKGNSILTYKQLYIAHYTKSLVWLRQKGAELMTSLPYNYHLLNTSLT